MHQNGGVSTQLAVEGRTLSTRGKVLVSIGAGIVVLSMVITGIAILTRPAKLVEVVTMASDATQDDRLALKAACGDLPGITLVKDQGDPAASVQGRFPVRFDIAKATVQQRIALETCINAHGEKVRGFLAEGDN
jgi:hypothetical protein